jgi:GT2 family glycosyltransferase
MTTFTIIIPVKPGRYAAAFERLKNILPDEQQYELLLAEGCAPSQQRNLAVAESLGDIVYFLDDDSMITIDNLKLCSQRMSDQSVAVVGGPSITPAGDSWLQQLFGHALASTFGSGAVHNRYRRYGGVRATTDSELILCNLAVRRSVFDELGGFNECLYPNEENEFLDRVASAGFTLLHDPDMFAFRSQRQTLKAFARQMFSYGRGRAQQSLITSSYSITSFIPLFFVIYLVIFLFGIKYVLLHVPLMLYLVAALVSSLLVVYRTGCLYCLLLLIIYPFMHIVNGVGLLWGLMNGKPAPLHDSSIRISKIIKLGKHT